MTMTSNTLTTRMTRSFSFLCLILPSVSACGDQDRDFYAAQDETSSSLGAEQMPHPSAEAEEGEPSDDIGAEIDDVTIVEYTPIARIGFDDGYEVFFERDPSSGDVIVTESGTINESLARLDTTSARDLTALEQFALLTDSSVPIPEVLVDVAYEEERGLGFERVLSGRQVASYYIDAHGQESQLALPGSVPQVAQPGSCSLVTGGRPSNTCGSWRMKASDRYIYGIESKCRSRYNSSRKVKGMKARLCNHTSGQGGSSSINLQTCHKNGSNHSWSCGGGVWAANGQYKFQDVHGSSYRYRQPRHFSVNSSEIYRIDGYFYNETGSNSHECGNRCYDQSGTTLSSLTVVMTPWPE
jgi:hypothetical protein